MPFGLENSTVASVGLYSALDARAVGMILVMIVALFLLALSSSRLFRRLKDASGRIGRVLYHVLVGVPVYLLGFVVYSFGEWVAEMANYRKLTPYDLGRAVLIFVGLYALGRVGEYVGKRIIENLRGDDESDEAVEI